MGNPIAFPFKACESELHLIRGRLDIHTDATVLATSVGKGITWSKTATGVYRGTLSAQYQGLAPSGGLGMQVMVTPVRSATTSLVKQVEAVSQTDSNGYFEVRTLDAAGAALDNTTTAFSINVWVIIHNSTVP